MPQSSVERASSAKHGRYSDLIVDPMEDATTRSSSPVTTRVLKTATVSLHPETPFSYTFLCLQNVFDRNFSDETRAQALYQVFIEIASEIESTSQFTNVMARIAENLGQLGCKAKPCTLHCDKSHNEPCTLSHAEPCTLSHAEPCVLNHFFVTPEPCTLEHALACTLPHNEPCTLQHAEPCTVLHIDPCTLPHAEPCTLAHIEPCLLNHFPTEPVTVAVMVPCPIAHNDPCTREHIPTPRPSLPKKTPSSLPLPLAPPAPNTSSIDKVNKRKRFKNKNKKRKLSDCDIHTIIAQEREDDINAMIARYGSEPEMDSDGFYANPNYGLRDALNNCFKDDDEISVDTTILDRQMREIDLELMQYPDPTSFAPHLEDMVNKRNAARIARGVCIYCGRGPTCCKCSASSTPSHVASPSAPPAPLPIAPLPSLPLPKVALPRARTEPLPSKPDKTSFSSRAQTAPPELSRNTLTARRCTTKDASPSSFVKFMDFPVTMTREHIHDCLKDNRKWSTVDISNVEIFAIKNKDSTTVNVLKIKFKDDAQSSTAKRVLTTMHAFKHRPPNIVNIGT
ncbi:hypothetical protein M378DRAFT_16118 [Amanita muscaria Koide BX008]|uniref:Uncharacterized protein n=1 Tax=Amanita muscaria (strain Koide BX008) TaxID=946122 RepID=A0A0C2S4N0_AMAMK|nr:hypothetical protein M378DRAFT_16118 [Amanita muscaria Koide BX008]